MGTHSDSTAVDSSRAEIFTNRLLEAFNSGGLCLMLSVGHRTGLFDALRGQPPSTVAEIARRAELDERYVREWLGAMTTARVVEISEDGERFSLPSEHAACLTRAAGADNLALYAEYFSVLGGVEDDIVDCFRNGGGVPYERFPRMHAVMAEDEGIVNALESQVLPMVPGLAERLRAGIRVLDAGCGSGRILNRLAQLFPKSRFVGLDFSEQALAVARGHAAGHGSTNIEFVARDLSDFDRTADPDAFDLVTTFDAIHDQGRPLNVLKGIHRTLRANGVYLMQDIKGSSDIRRNLDHPVGTFLYTISTMHCMTVSLAQGGEGLGAMWGEEKTREYLGRAGFTSVEKHEIAHDILNNWYVVRK
jgi:ubiquinone/menaquinone biosynthesis C-methylase UbiE